MHRNLDSVDQAAAVAQALTHIVSDANQVGALMGAILVVHCA